MKMLFVTLSLLVSFASVANADFRGPETYISGKVIGTEPLCPEDVTCVTNGTIVKLEFTLMGCLDALAPLEYSGIAQDGVVSVKAINVANPQSQVVLCERMPTEIRTIELVNEYPPFTIQFFGTGTSVEVE
jgi:hypothetical protein